MGSFFCNIITMENCSNTLYDTRVKDGNRLCELGFIDLEERGIRADELLMQEISDELNRITQVLGHPNHFPLNK